MQCDRSSANSRIRAFCPAQMRCEDYRSAKHGFQRNFHVRVERRFDF